MTAKLTFYGGVNEIGGNKILLQTEDGSVLLDFGRRMGEYGKFFSEFLVARSKETEIDESKMVMGSTSLVSLTTTKRR